MKRTPKHYEYKREMMPLTEEMIRQLPQHYALRQFNEMGKVINYSGQAIYNVFKGKKENVNKPLWEAIVGYVTERGDLAEVPENGKRQGNGAKSSVKTEKSATSRPNPDKKLQDLTRSNVEVKPPAQKKTNYVIPPRPVKEKTENSLDYAGRLNNWKKKYNL